MLVAEVDHRISRDERDEDRNQRDLVVVVQVELLDPAQVVQRQGLAADFLAQLAPRRRDRRLAAVDLAVYRLPRPAADLIAGAAQQQRLERFTPPAQDVDIDDATRGRS